MKQSHFCLALAGLCFGGAPEGWGQPIHCDSTASTPKLTSCQRCKSADSTACELAKNNELPAFLRGIQITGGQLTIPFKIRPKAEHGTFRLTTDVTLGGFIGLTKRLSEKKEHFITIPMTAGLTFVNINNNNTSMEFAATDEGVTDVVPGLSWSSGILLQFDQYNLGLIFGKDYASQVGDQWLYHRKMWWSFGVGFSFTQ